MEDCFPWFYLPSSPPRNRATSMEDVSASKNPKRTNTKKDKEDMMPKTPFFSKMKRITNTNIGTVDMIQMKDRVKEGQSPLAKRIQRAVVHRSPSVDTSISIMTSDIGAALDFEDIREEDINETDFGSRLDELGKVAIKKKHLGTLSSLSAFIGFAKEYEKDHKKILQAASGVAKSAELRVKHTPCPPMEEINKRLAKFIVLAKKMKEKGRAILEDHLM